ncbi:MAG: hypothetical protein Q4A55_07125 [Aerococcus sp.]|nr:hypothetical protein [Aerococcus sp.]
MQAEEQAMVLDKMKALSNLASEHHAQTEIARFLNETASDLDQKSGVAFTEGFRYFLNHGKLVKSSSDVTFNTEEQQLWQELYDMQQVGNDLGGAGLQW